MEEAEKTFEAYTGPKIPSDIENYEEKITPPQENSVTDCGDASFDMSGPPPPPLFEELPKKKKLGKKTREERLKEKWGEEVPKAKSLLDDMYEKKMVIEELKNVLNMRKK